MSSYSETNRKLLHIAMGVFAALLRVLTWQQAAALAAAAIVFNAVALPRLAPQIVRADGDRGARAGLLYYPASVLLLVLLFPSRLDIVAVAWAIMAAGDGAATIVGRAVGGPPLPWNREKSWAGLLAFVIAGGIAGVALSLWVAPAIDPVPLLVFSVWAPLVAVVVAALIETLPLRLDDNIRVPSAAGLSLWFLSQLHWSAPPDSLVLDVIVGAAVALPLAYVARRVGRISTAGALVGMLFASAIYAAMFLVGLVVLGTALALAILCSQLSRRRLHAGTHGDDERRGAGNIIANCVVGTSGAVLEILSFDWGLELTAVWFVAGIAAGASDTVASEIGRAFGGRPRTFPFLRHASAGTPGAVSVGGTIAGMAGAALIAAPAAAGWLMPWSFVAPVIVACTCGAFVESALATLFEASGTLDNHSLNFLNTATAAAVAVWWCSRLVGVETAL